MEPSGERGLERLERASLAPVFVLWCALGLLVVAVLATYARVPADDLYAVSRDGIAGGASRALVLIGYPISLAAIASLGFVVDRALGHGSVAFRRAVVGGAIVSLVLCATVGVPGVVDQGDLDAKPVNALAAIGVLLAISLAVVVARRTGVGSFRPWTRFDWVGGAAALVLLLAAIPWIAADLSFSISETPVLGQIFLGDELVSYPAEPELAPAVHLGHHHGMDGVLFALIAILFLREAPGIGHRWLRRVTTVYVSLALVYGLANAVQDGWLEQVVKRGSASKGLPNMLRPDISWAWAGIVVATAIVATMAMIRSSGGRAGRP